MAVSPFTSMPGRPQRPAMASLSPVQPAHSAVPTATTYEPNSAGAWVNQKLPQFYAPAATGRRLGTVAKPTDLAHTELPRSAVATRFACPAPVGLARGPSPPPLPGTELHGSGDRCGSKGRAVPPMSPSVAHPVRTMRSPRGVARSVSMAMSHLAHRRNELATYGPRRCDAPAGYAPHVLAQSPLTAHGSAFGTTPLEHFRSGNHPDIDYHPELALGMPPPHFAPSGPWHHPFPPPSEAAVAGYHPHALQLGPMHMLPPHLLPPMAFPGACGFGGQLPEHPVHAHALDPVLHQFGFYEV